MRLTDTIIKKMKHIFLNIILFMLHTGILLLMIIFLAKTIKKKYLGNNAIHIKNDTISISDHTTGIKKPAKDIAFAKDIKISNVPAGKKVNETSPQYIRQRIEQLTGNTLKRWTEEKKMIYPPQYVLFRVFKLEKELEIWAGNNSKEPLELIKILNICAIDNEPGPKLQEGDGKTPEGFYEYRFLYASNFNFMWIKLDTDKIDDFGKTGYGSCFKMYLNYPKSIDRKRTNTYVGKVSPGGEICMHGNCITAGCISFKNRTFLYVYAFAIKHNQKLYGLPQIHIFPFRFTDSLKNMYCDSCCHIKCNKLLEFWNNLERGYKLFDSIRKPLKITESEDLYMFTTKDNY
jgi:murein L,D-transpeptidase YafK